jgi:hypothetical protein
MCGRAKSARAQAGPKRNGASDYSAAPRTPNGTLKLTTWRVGPEASVRDIAEREKNAAVRSRSRLSWEQISQLFGKPLLATGKGGSAG